MGRRSERVTGSAPTTAASAPPATAATTPAASRLAVSGRSFGLGGGINRSGGRSHGTARWFVGADRCHRAPSFRRRRLVAFALVAHGARTRLVLHDALEGARPALV